MASDSSPRLSISDELPQHTDAVLRVVNGFAASQALFNADELNIFNLIDEGTCDLAALSEATGIAPGPLERMLIVCCVVGLLRRDAKSFQLSDAARACLVKGQPGYVGGLFSFFQRDLYPVFQHLEKGLREQQPQWVNVPEIGESGPFEAIYRDEKSLREFQAAMFQLSYPTALAASDHFDFSRFRYAVDLGGGTGGFLAGLCERVPALQGVIFDLPPVEKLALEQIASRGHEDRVEFVSGDIFNDPLPQNADMFVLGDILHDWGWEEGNRLLEKVYKALPENGVVCIVENLFNEQRDGPYFTAIVNLFMLVATFGEQRTPAEFDEWLTGIGFDRVEAHVLPAPRGIVVGWKTSAGR